MSCSSASPRNAALEELRGLALVQFQAAGLTWVEVFQPEALPFGDAERVDVLPYPVEDFFSRHAATSFRDRRPTFVWSAG